MSEQERPFYVTTPIYYINDAPHVGHAYTTIACDALARYHRMRGRDVRFQTGTDEHGLKAAQSAEAQGIHPRELADRNVARYRAAWRKLEISEDRFIRTTEEAHVQGAQALWQQIAKAGDIYKGSYSGPYCVGCEAFYTEGQLDEGRCPADGDHRLETLEEDSYFFRLSAFQEPLLELYRSRPDFVAPASRMNEVRSFVEMGLEDLSVSRTKFDWGIPVPGDPGHVMYVWIEALSNYITGLGYGSDDTTNFERYWPDALHVVGKDILRFHAVYWPAFLMSAGLEPPRQVLAHGWWLKNEQKMSKTRGNVADPFALETWFGADATRYFLMREIALGADGNYSEEAVVDRINADLANDLGNTLSRVARILARDLDGRVPQGSGPGGLEAKAKSSWAGYLRSMDAAAPQDALRCCWQLLDATNKFLVQHEPWKLVKDPDQRAQLEHVMGESAEALRHVAAMVAPVMPAAARSIWASLGLDADPLARVLVDERGEPEWGFPTTGGPVVHGEPLFPRIDKKAFFAGLDVGKDAPQSRGGKNKGAASAKPGAPGKKAKSKELPEGTIGIEDVMKVQLRTALVESCKKHPDADKLLVLGLDDGSGEPRTICAGVAAHYEPEELAGKTIVIVANLAARKLRGIPSQGMLLAANHGSGEDERVVVITLPDDVPPGAEVR